MVSTSKPSMALELCLREGRHPPNQGGLEAQIPWIQQALSLGPVWPHPGLPKAKPTPCYDINHVGEQSCNGNR